MVWIVLPREARSFVRETFHDGELQRTKVGGSPVIYSFNASFKARTKVTLPVRKLRNSLKLRVLLVQKISYNELK